MISVNVNNPFLNLFPNDPDQFLEFGNIKKMLHSKRLSELCYEAIEYLEFYTDPEMILEKLNQAVEFLEIINSERNFPTNNYLDIRDRIKFLEIENSTLTEDDFFKIIQIGKTILAVFDFFKTAKEEYPSLRKIIKDTIYEKKLFSGLKEVIDEEGHIRSDASSILANLRLQKAKKEKEIDREFNRELANARKNGWLSGESETIRHGSRVLAFQAIHKRKIKGITVDQSSTGQTIFIQPESILQLINESFELAMAEKKEIFTILNKLTFFTRAYKTSLEQYQLLLGEFDFIRARALLAFEMKAKMPQISNEPCIHMVDAFHPLLFLHHKESGRKTVPLSLTLDKNNSIIVISGPNAGGKSVCLKTIGLLQLMVQSGLLIPSGNGTRISPFKKIFIEIGDNQSIENDLSTYSSHLKNMKYFEENADPHTLFLIDEFGSGTDPQTGGVIAERILNSLHKKNAFGVVTTHYSNLKIFANETKGINNAAFEFDLKHLKPTYRLSVGQPGSSFSFEILKTIGFEKKLTEEIGKKLSEVNAGLDSLLLSLQIDKIKLEELKKQIQNKEFQLDKMINENRLLKEKYDSLKNTVKLEAKEKAREFLNNINRRFEKMILEWQKSKDKKESIAKVKSAINFEKNKITQEIRKTKEQVLRKENNEPVTVGSRVKFKEGIQSGQVIEIKKDKAIVIFGNVKTTVSLTEIEISGSQENAQKQIISVSSDLISKKFYPVIDIRGARKDEALNKVGKFMDQALLSSFKLLKIIHGTGDGVLRLAVRDFLRKFDCIKSLESDKPESGGDGVTIITLE